VATPEMLGVGGGLHALGLLPASVIIILYDFFII
jgi:hypothetical protein